MCQQVYLSNNKNTHEHQTCYPIAHQVRSQDFILAGAKGCPSQNILFFSKEMPHFGAFLPKRDYVQVFAVANSSVVCNGCAPYT